MFWTIFDSFFKIHEKFEMMKIEFEIEFSPAHSTVAALLTPATLRASARSAPSPAAPCPSRLHHKPAAGGVPPQHQFPRHGGAVGDGPRT